MAVGAGKGEERELWPWELWGGGEKEPWPWEQGGGKRGSRGRGSEWGERGLRSGWLCCGVFGLILTISFRFYLCFSSTLVNCL